MSFCSLTVIVVVSDVFSFSYQPPRNSSNMYALVLLQNKHTTADVRNSNEIFKYLSFIHLWEQISLALITF